MDAGFPLDSGREPDADALVDASPPDDSTSPDAEAPLPTVVREGRWSGRGGYDAAGAVTLEHLGGARYAVVTSDDFATAAVPSPVLLLSDRDALGTAITAADLRVATLGAGQLRGAHRFEIELDAIPAFAWIYCEPFGIETARAPLEAP